MSESAVTQTAGMPCPRCRVDLVMTERMGVEIDYCPKCRGVWLDRGELDKIIERSEQFSAKPPEAASPPPAQPAQSPWQAAPQGQAQQPVPQQQGGWDQGHGHGHGYGGGHGHDGYGRHGSFLGRLFG
jgi:hypothetical protein